MKAKRNKPPEAGRKTHPFRTRTALFSAAVLLCLAAAGSCVGIVWMRREIQPHFDDALMRGEGIDRPSRLYYYAFTDRAARIGKRVLLPGGELENGTRFVPAVWEEIPTALKDAVVAMEDKRFYTHHGVDWYRTLGAAANYLCKGRLKGGRFGGSSLTQQLVKNLTGENENTVRRKLQETVWANDLENRYTKEEILLRYLNIANLSGGCRGVGAAAKRWFGKNTADLTLAECATLAAILPNPSYYNPARFPEHVEKRRNLVLATMAKEGYITEETAQTAAALPLALCENGENDAARITSWYTDMVVEDVIADLCTRRGMTRQSAAELVYYGGLTIETAVDPRVQTVLDEWFSDKSRFFLGEEGVQCSMLVVHPETGDILGVAGAVGKKEGCRLQNYATMTRRPPASALKPLSVYAPALEAGVIGWNTVLDDIPVYYTETLPDGTPAGPWPHNAGGTYRGLTDMRCAVAHSTNTIAVRVLERLGRENAFDFLQNALEMQSLVRTSVNERGKTVTDICDAALALGQTGFGVTLRELVGGYTALANDGVFTRPRSYFRVLDGSGQILLSNETTVKTVLSEQTAAIVTGLLEAVVREGTGREAALGNTAVAVAGKTGTSGDDRDRWFVGYTPELLAGVWYGFPNPKPLTGFSVSPAVTTWQACMEKICRVLQCEKQTFSLPPELVCAPYCRDSGDAPTVLCRADPRGSRVSWGLFRRGTEPVEHCTCHDTEESIFAEGASPLLPMRIRRRIGLRHTRQVAPGIRVSDSPYLLPAA